MLLKDIKFYINLVITIVISYLIIKLIDNYKYFFSLFDTLVSVLTPFIIGFILAYIFNPIVTFIERNFEIKRLFALFITYGAIIFILVSFLFITGPILMDNILDLINQLPTYAVQTQDFLNYLGNSLNNIDPATLQNF